MSVGAPQLTSGVAGVSRVPPACCRSREEAGGVVALRLAICRGPGYGRGPRGDVTAQAARTDPYGYRQRNSCSSSIPASNYQAS